MIGHDTAASFKAFANRRVTKFIVACVLLFVLVRLCFELTAVKERSFGITWPSFPWPSETWKSQQERDMLQLSTEAVSAMGVPQDVLRDSVRSNASGEDLCPLVPPNLVGYIPTILEVPSLKAVEAEFPDVMEGGHFRPKECTSRHRVAILVPYRDRAQHLNVFIYNLHRVLARQQIDYGVFVIEQGDKEGFNRAKLLNVGYLESTALYDYKCFVFHDIDLVPADDRNVYTCPEQPRHMSVRIDDHSGVPYPMMFGGVSAVNKEQMLAVNGYSNLYWGWGGEDDDMSYRLHNLHWTIHRRPASVARYTGLKHVKSKPNENRVAILRRWKERYKTDGLNSVNYTRKSIIFKKLYTWILVDLTASKSPQKNATGTHAASVITRHK